MFSKTNLITLRNGEHSPLAMRRKRMSPVGLWEKLIGYLDFSMEFCFGVTYGEKDKSQRGAGGGPTGKWMGMWNRLGQAPVPAQGRPRGAAPATGFACLITGPIGHSLEWTTVKAT